MWFHAINRIRVFRSAPDWCVLAHSSILILGVFVFAGMLATPAYGRQSADKLVDRMKSSFALLRTCPEEAAKEAVATLADYPEAPNAVRAQLHWIAGSGFAISEHFDASLQQLQQCERLARDMNDVKLLRRTLRYKAPSLFQLGRFYEAGIAAREALDLCEFLDDGGPYLAVILNELAGAELQLGEFDASAEHFRTALDIARAQGNQDLESMILYNLGDVYRGRGDHESAIQVVSEALQIARQQNNSFLILHCQIDLTSSHLAKGDITAAEEMHSLVTSDPQLFGPGTRTAAVVARINAGDLAVLKNDISTARQHFFAAKQEYDQLEDTAGLRSVAVRLAALSSTIEDNYATASSELTALIEEAESQGVLLEELNYRGQLVEVLVQQEQWKAAFEQLKMIAEKKEASTLQQHSDVVDQILAELNFTKAQAQIAQLEIEAQKDQARYQQQKTATTIVSSLAIVTIVALILLGRAYTRKQQALIELREAQAEIRRQQQRQLAIERTLAQRQKTESIELLVSGICHDFNNMLMAISGQAEIGQFQEDSGDKNARFEQIVRTSGDAASLTKNLVEYIGPGRQPGQYCDISALVARSELLLQSFVPEKGRLVLKPLQAPLYAAVDEIRCGQILLNLIANAALSGVTCQSVTVSTSQQTLSQQELNDMILGDQATAGEFCKLEVADTGCGMSSDMIARIFDPYFSTRESGRGLGLASVFGIVRSCGGAIQVESQVGQGSTFRIFFPRVLTKESTDVAKPVSTLPSINVVDRDATIIVVDDDQLVRESAIQILSSAGLCGIGAANATDALRLIHQHAGSVRSVVTDFAMPEHSGSWLAEQLKKIDPQLPVIISSGSTVPVNKQHQAHAALLPKPYTARQLVDCIQTAMHLERDA